MKNYYRELKNLGLNERQIEGLTVFVQGQVAEEVYRQAVGVFTADELKELEKKGKKSVDKIPQTTNFVKDRGDVSDQGEIRDVGGVGDVRGVEEEEMRKGMEVVERAYFDKTGKTLQELGGAILIEYLEQLTGLIKDLQTGMKKVAGASKEDLAELKKAMEAKDTKRIKQVLDKIM